MIMMHSGPSGSVSDDDDLFFPHPEPSFSSALSLSSNFVDLSAVDSSHQASNLKVLSNDAESYFTNARMYGSTPPSAENGNTTFAEQSPSSQPLSSGQNSKERVTRQGSIVDGLLHEIYDRWHCGRSDSIDSDTLTECSSTSDFVFHSRHEPGGYHSAVERRHAGQLNKSFLQNQSLPQVQRMLSDLQRSIAVMNARLLKQLKRRERRSAKLQRNCDIVTAILQAASLKRQIDTRMKFSIQPPPGQSAFDQWRDAMKAVCRLPMGLPPEFRKKVWLSLADHYLLQLKINWDKTVRFVFNERSNPDDEQLGMQIVKDLHRTGCSNFSGDDNDEDRAVLKRLLLAYARWNKRVGYCQGFNVIAALLLNVMDRKEDDALKVMIYLIDSVLPESYFANNLRALSVDMAVFRDLLRLTYPKLSKHLDRLQLAAQDIRTGACYEPPLTNVFTMQWFLTLFATCLPVNIVLRVWDSILLEGSEVLLRTALTIWGKLAKRIMGASSADEFYSLMGELSSSVMQGSVFDGDSMVKSIYSLGDFPLPHLNELREKYTYNIRPFSQPSGSNNSSSKRNGNRNIFKSLLNSDEDELDDDDITAMACMPGGVDSSSDISVLGPGVYGSGASEEGASKSSAPMERMSTDIQSLKLQYQRLKQRQQQAHIIIAAASAKKAQQSASRKLGVPGVPAAALVPNIESPVAMNHLFLGKTSTSTRNRVVTDGPRIAAPMHARSNSGLLAKQLQAVANAQAVSKSKRMRTGVSSRNSSAGPQPATSSDEESTVTSSQQETSSASSQELKATIDESDLDKDSTELSQTQPDSSETISSVDESHPTSNSAHGITTKSQAEVALSSDTARSSPETMDSLPITSSLGSDFPPTGSDMYEGSDGSDADSQDTECLSPNSTDEISETCEAVKESDVNDAFVQNVEFLVGNLSTVKLPTCQIELGHVNVDSTSVALVTDSGDSVVTGDDVSLTVSNSDADPKWTNQNFPVLDSETVGRLSCSEHCQADSGVDSPSAESPITTPGRKLRRQGRVLDGPLNVVSLEEEMILSVEEDKSTKAKTSLPALYSGCPDSQDAGNPSDVTINMSVQKTLESLSQDSLALEKCTVGLSLSEPLPAVYDEQEIVEDMCQMNQGKSGTVESDNRVSVSSSEGSAEVFPFLELNPPSLQSPGFFERSSSVIETVSVPECVGVRNSDEKSSALTSNTQTQKLKKTASLSMGKEPGSDRQRVSKLSHTSTKKTHVNQHTMIVSHKSSSHSRKSRRFSSPARPDVASSGSQNMGFPAIVKKTSRPFNPFPVRHFNTNRAKTGLKLGLYSESTLEQLGGLKPRTRSS